MAGELRGFDVVLKVNTGTFGSPVWTMVGSQKSFTFPGTMSPVDISSKDSLDNAYLPGRRDRKITLDGVYAPSDAAQALLIAAFEANTLIQVCRTEDSTNRQKISGYVTSCNKTGADGDAGVFNIEIQCTGAWAAI